MKSHLELPVYRGKKYIHAKLPVRTQSWPLGKFHSTRKDTDTVNGYSEQLPGIFQQYAWQWPKRHIYFFSDLHADADAFMASLVASGGIKKTGYADQDFKLTEAGKKARYVIGGDCFDKGPSNLRLLRCIRLLINTGARVHILAGNHDIRVKLGIRSVDLKNTNKSEHFFIRMGRKAIPFLLEIEREYLQGSQALMNIPDDATCRARIFPSADWFDKFPETASGMMSPKAIDKELKRLKEKTREFETDCLRVGLSLRSVYAAAKKWQQLFLLPEGEFYWYFKKMRLALQKGSFLFVHAGLDDKVAAMLSKQGVKYLNHQYKQHISSDLFEFYYGPLANTIRTKYRDVDLPMSRFGVKMINAKGIYAIVHGHKNLRYGQRITLRKGLINFECDASVDRNTRKKEFLARNGAAVTIINPTGQVLGISTDYPFIKVFEPDNSKKSHERR